MKVQNNSVDIQYKMRSIFNMKFKLSKRFACYLMTRQAMIPKSLTNAAHTWACYQELSIGWLRIGWLSYKASRHYYAGEKSISVEDFNYRRELGWAMKKY